MFEAVRCQPQSGSFGGFSIAAAGDLRLQSNSPCINSGTNGYAVTATDLDGNPRIIAEAVGAGQHDVHTIREYADLGEFIEGCTFALALAAQT